MQQIHDIDTVGYKNGVLGNFFDFHINNTFYLLAPDYYFSLYSIYLNRCISLYDGWVGGWHNAQSGLVPQRALQTIGRGLTNMLFAHGIDFTGNEGDYEFACKWAKKTKFYKAIRKGYEQAVAGGTSLLKINRINHELVVSSHRIDTFFADVDGSGKIVGVRVFFDAIHNTNKTTGTQTHYGICEERYFNAEGKACVMASVYRASANLQTEVQSRPQNLSTRVNWENLPFEVRNYIKDHHPSIMIGKEQYLPFSNSLGCCLLKFTDSIPQMPNLFLGQPIGDILATESFQYDQLKYFEKNEVDLARARALIPEEMWNKEDPDYDSRALSERFFQKVSSISGDNDKVTPIQFALRGNDIKTQKENIYHDIAFKLNISASSVATFLSDGAGARTATEIDNEKTKSDTWQQSQINLNKPEIDDLLTIIMNYYNRDSVEIIFRSENQSSALETIKVWGDQLSAGNITPKLYVRKVHKDLTIAQQDQEIKSLEQQKQLKIDQQLAYVEQSTKNP